MVQGKSFAMQLPEHVAAVNKVIKEQHAEIGRDDENFRLLNFWAWHVKDNQDDARAEARVWLAMRATPWEMFYHRGILPDEDMQKVWDNMGPINRAYYKRDPNIPEVPADILDRLVDQCSSTSTIDNIDHEMDRFKRFEAAGLTDICIRVYDKPENSIRLIGEQVMPAFH